MYKEPRLTPNKFPQISATMLRNTLFSVQIHFARFLFFIAWVLLHRWVPWAGQPVVWELTSYCCKVQSILQIWLKNVSEIDFIALFVVPCWHRRSCIFICSSNTAVTRSHFKCRQCFPLLSVHSRACVQMIYKCLHSFKGKESIDDLYLGEGIIPSSALVHFSWL